MSEARAAELQAVDPATLIDIVRQDQRSPNFEIAGWSVRPLSDRGFVTTDGLWLVSGLGRDAAGERPWAVAVKIIGRQEPEPPRTPGLLDARAAPGPVGPGGKLAWPGARPAILPSGGKA